MPLVVLDPIVLVNTAKVPLGMSAKLLTLLAYGQACAYVQRGAAAEMAGMADLAGHGALGWGTAAERAYDNALAKKAELEKSIPSGPSGFPPGDWRMAVSRELQHRMIKRIGQLRDKQQVELDGGQVWGTIVSHAHEVLWETWAVNNIPEYIEKKHRDANVSIHTALRVGASFLITKDPAVCADPQQATGYSYASAPPQASGPQLIAVHLDWLVNALREADFDLESVDPTVLERIAPTGPQGPKKVVHPQPSKAKHALEIVKPQVERVVEKAKPPVEQAVEKIKPQVAKVRARRSRRQP